MADRATHLPSQLSGGEQQRVAIARALVNDPKIILADEPTGNLDAENQHIVFELLSDLHAQGRTIVMVTHDENAGRLADRRINLDHGRIKETLVFSAEENQDFDEVLEHLWTRGERGGHMESHRFHRNAVAHASSRHCRASAWSRSSNGEENVHAAGEQRARNVIRRHRLAERLFMDVLSIQRRSRNRIERLQVRAHSQPRRHGPHLHAARPSRRPVRTAARSRTATAATEKRVLDTAERASVLSGIGARGI